VRRLCGPEAVKHGDAATSTVVGHRTRQHPHLDFRADSRCTLPLISLLHNQFQLVMVRAQEVRVAMGEAATVEGDNVFIVNIPL
jgi:hypothetical protein